jgi:hypothetical protein
MRVITRRIRLDSGVMLGRTVYVRIIQFLALSFMKTWLFIDEYLTGLSNDNPYALIFTARAQMEAFAVVDTTRFA